MLHLLPLIYLALQPFHQLDALLHKLEYVLKTADNVLLQTAPFLALEARPTLAPCSLVIALTHQVFGMIRKAFYKTF